MIGKVLAWFGLNPPRPRLDGENCKTCVYFDDYSGVSDEDEPNGYCMNPTGHQAYGGHWTHTDDWCVMFERLEGQ